MSFHSRRLGACAALIACGWLASPTAVAAGDAEAGRQIAQSVCVGCHGADGNSINPAWPNLAGQVRGYIASQLRAFKAGTRVSAEMAGFVAALSEQDMDNLDAFYASQAAKPGSITEDEAETAQRGERIYRGGLLDRSVAACMGCHGPGGKGIPTQFPRVSGQHMKYLEKQLLAFKSGQRTNEIMNDIAFLMSEQEIAEVATYMQGLD